MEFFLESLGYPKGSKIELTLNHEGFNQINNYTTEKLQNTFRIITLGDSFTFGRNVNTEDNYPSQLQKLLDNSCPKTRFEVLNLGVGGYDIKYTVERYKLRGKKYNPDLILWFVIPNDFMRINELLIPRNDMLIEKMKQSGELYQDIKNGYYYRAWKDATDGIETELGKEKILHMQEAYMSEIKLYFNKELLIFSLGLPSDSKLLVDRFVKSQQETFFYTELPNIYTNEKTYLPDKHPSPYGYKLITENLFDYLKKSKLIPCGN